MHLSFHELNKKFIRKLIKIRWNHLLILQFTVSFIQNVITCLKIKIQIIKVS